MGGVTWGRTPCGSALDLARTVGTVPRDVSAGADVSGFILEATEKSCTHRQV